jgi:hypothetical protein
MILRKTQYFILGAVAAFISVLISRMNRIIDRSQALNAIKDDDASKAHFKSDIPHLRRRAALLNSAILFSTVSAIITSVLVIVAFVCAFYNMRHEYAVAFARAASGHAAAPPSSVMNSRRRIPDTRASPLVVGPPHP